MKTEQIITITLIILTLIGIGFDIIYFNIPYWITNSDFPDLSDLRRFILRILGYFSNVLMIIGTIKLIQKQEIKLLKIFSLPLYLSIIQTILFLIVCSFSEDISYFTGLINEDLPFYILLLRIVNLAFVLLVAYHFLTIEKAPTYERTTKKVPNIARFKNRLIDGSLILLLSYNYIDFLIYGETIFSPDSFFNSNPYWLIIVITIVYYFVLELLFHQTIGKLHNNSFVKIEGNRFGAVLGRTFARFIPLEAFSFFGDEGWHDGISGTSVVTIDETVEGENEASFDEFDDLILDDFE